MCESSEHRYNCYIFLRRSCTCSGVVVVTAIETQNSFHKVLNGLLMKQGPFVGSCYLSEWFTMYLDLHGYFCPLIILHDPYFSRKGGPEAPQVKSPHINTSYE